MPKPSIDGLVEETRHRILASADHVCLDRARRVTAAWQRFERDPLPVRRARALEHVLGGMALDLETNPVFAGSTASRPRAWVLRPEYGIGVAYHVPTENPELAHLLDGDAVPADMRAYWQDRAVGGGGGIGHLIVRHDLVIERGLEHFIALTEADHGPSTPEQAAYRRACRIACEAVIAWAQRHAVEAERMAGQTPDPVRAAALRRVADACRHVPARPARNLFEALQSILFVHFALHLEGHAYSVSLGPLDRWLARFADGPEPDLEGLLAAFLLKFSQVSLWGSHVMGQPITLGGTDADGRDVCNRLTLAFLAACRRIRMPDPYLFVRWHSGLDARVKTLSAEMLAGGTSFPLLSGDAETRAGLERAGIRPADGAEYALIGCNELGIPGKLISVPCGGTEELESLRAVVAAADAGRLADTNAVMARMQVALRERLQTALRDGWTAFRGAEQKAPTPFTSALMDGCIERGRDLHGALTYDRINLYVQGFTNVVNSLAAIEQVVFRDRAATMDELSAALRSNYAGAVSLRRRLLEAPKWGNDDPAADVWAERWLAARDAAAADAAREAGVAPPLYCHVVRSMHLSRGRRIGATPDGRCDGDRLADSIGAPAGTLRRSPTAVLNSVRRVDPVRHWLGGYNLNLTLPSCVPPAAIRHLVDGFLGRGGQELQVNVLDATALRAAQAHPEQHVDLVVRIAGYSAHFCRLTRVQQDELIGRAEEAAVTCDVAGTRSAASGSADTFVGRVREGMLAWLESIRDTRSPWGRWPYHAAMTRPYALISSAWAIQILDELDALRGVDEAAKGAAVAFFRDCQDPRDGHFKDPLVSETDHVGPHSWEDIFGQMDTAAEALRRLGAVPRYPMPKVFAADPGELGGTAYTLSFDWANPWHRGEAWYRGIAAYYDALPAESRQPLPVAIGDALRTYESRILDPETGVPSRRMPRPVDGSVAMAGLFKTMFAYRHLGLPVPAAERAIDFTLALQHPDGEFGFGSNMCINWDALWVLRELDRQLGGAYRFADIRAAGRRTAERLLAGYRKPDGGFAFGGALCTANHHSIRLCPEPRPIGDTMGSLMALRCLVYADEWDARRPVAAAAVPLTGGGLAGEADVPGVAT